MSCEEESVLVAYDGPIPYEKGVGAGFDDDKRGWKILRTPRTAPRTGYVDRWTIPPHSGRGT